MSKRLSKENSLFIDESGDLGFSKKSSKHFIISGVMGNEREFGRIIQKIRKNLPKKDKKIHEFKFVSSKPNFRIKMLQKALKVKNFGVFAIVVIKENVKPHLRKYKSVGYNYFLNRFLTFHEEEIRGTKIVVDKWGGYLQETRRKNYIEEFTGYNIALRESHASGGIQFADFVVGGLFANFERKDDKYLKEIEKKSRIFVLFPDGVRMKKRIL